MQDVRAEVPGLALEVEVEKVKENERVRFIQGNEAIAEGPGGGRAVLCRIPHHTVLRDCGDFVKTPAGGWGGICADGGRDWLNSGGNRRIGCR